MEQDSNGLKARWGRLFSDRKTKREIAAAQQSADDDPRNPRWPHKLGELHHKAGDLNAAMKAWRRAIKLYALQGHLGKAIALTRMAQREDPGDVRLNHMMDALLEEETGTESSLDKIREEWGARRVH